MQMALHNEWENIFPDTTRDGDWTGDNLLQYLRVLRAGVAV